MNGTRRSIAPRTHAIPCPACNSRMEISEAGSVTIDICRIGCGGMWFDHKELLKVDEPDETDGELLAHLAVAANAADETSRRRCPVCPETVLMRHWYSFRRIVEVDECPGCGGYFLDRDELSEIRDEFSGASDRRQATAAALESTVGEELGVQLALARHQTDRVKDVCKMLKFRLRYW